MHILNSTLKISLFKTNKSFKLKSFNKYIVLIEKNMPPSSNEMRIVPIEALSDNYMYLLIDEQSKECAAIDPVEPKKILDHLIRFNLKLTHVLTTHHHWDHADGNPALIKLCENSRKKIPVYGGDDRIPALTNKINHNDTIKIGSSLKVTCLFTPCHTAGHICYYVTGSKDATVPCVFTGDTLFLAGCGRFFEGNAEQMHNNFKNILAKLPKETVR
jgi:hydroxyacylglutathione hydrolase